MKSLLTSSQGSHDDIVAPLLRGTAKPGWDYPEPAEPRRQDELALERADPQYSSNGGQVRADAKSSSTLTTPKRPVDLLKEEQERINRQLAAAEDGLAEQRIDVAGVGDGLRAACTP